MEFVTGFAVWLAIGLAGGIVARSAYRAEANTMLLAVVFGVFGAFIGGMLGTAAHVFHDPVPLRMGGLIGAVSGGLGFPLIYQFIARNVV